MSKTRVPHKFEELPVFEIDSQTVFHYVSGSVSTVAKFRLKKGTKTTPKSHTYEQFTYVVEGSLLYTVDNRSILAKKGDFIYVPSGAIHYVDVRKDTVLLDFFSPAWPNLPESIGARRKVAKEL